MSNLPFYDCFQVNLFQCDSIIFMFTEKVLKRLNFEISKPHIEALVNCKPGVIEYVLMQLQHKVSSESLLHVVVV